MDFDMHQYRLYFKLMTTIFLFLATSVISEEMLTSDGGKIKFYETDCYGSDGSDCDIIVEKYKDKMLLWKTLIGGNSWDYVENVLEVDDGYLILGNTGSYGAGNNDVYLTKLDGSGKEIWFETYGGFFNDYGRTIDTYDYPDGYIIEGEKQHCLTENVSNECYMEDFFIHVDGNGINLQDNF
jgi:hypothetical protein